LVFSQGFLLLYSFCAWLVTFRTRYIRNLIEEVEMEMVGEGEMVEEETEETEDEVETEVVGEMEITMQ
jgi:hypothetical protein